MADYLSREGAQALARKIQDVWTKRNVPGVKVEIVEVMAKMSNHDRLDLVYAVRSNIAKLAACANWRPSGNQTFLPSLV